MKGRETVIGNDSHIDQRSSGTLRLTRPKLCTVVLEHIEPNG
jgi:hypothetical protein